jgi:hypothetical protein
MKKLHCKTKLSTIPLILLLTVSAIIVALPVADAHDPPWEITTYCFISASPNPGAVEQIVYVNAWINWVPPTANAQWGDRWNFTLNITDPTGHTDAYKLTSDATGGTYTSFTPTMVGEYTIEVTFEEQVLEGLNPPPSGARPSEYLGDVFKSSNASMALTVQEDHITDYPNNPLPDDYWQRPIHATNTEWYTLGGHWLGLGIQLDFAQAGLYDQNGGFNPYSQAPKTPHVLWTQPVAFGGQVGGSTPFPNGDKESIFYAGLQYEPKFAPVIIGDILYYVNLPSASNRQGWTAQNIRTGEILWTKNTAANLRCGQLLHFLTPNQYGGTPYLWGIQGSDWIMVDAFSGADILTITGFSGASYLSLWQDELGSLIGYYMNLTDYTVNAWNSTQCILGPNSTTWSWRPQTGASYDFSRGKMWSATVPLNQTEHPMSFVPGFGGLNILSISQEDGVIVMTDCMTGTWQTENVEMGFSTEDGSLLWGPIIREREPYTGKMVGPCADGIYTVYTKETRTWRGYNITTGEEVWGPTDPYDESWGYYNQRSATYAYGNLYAWSLGGGVYCFDMQTGKKQWEFSTGSSGTESVYGNWPLWIINNYEACIADGIIFVEGGHTYNPPMFKGSKIYAIDAADGTLVWDTLGFFCSSPLAIAGGVLLGINSYDNQIYAFGKGQTATTVEGPDRVVPSGELVLITGTVTDQSSGQTCLGIPAKGTPAIADAYQDVWMEYLYQQQPKPQNATGVEVILEAFDQDNNFYEIGTTTSDATGFYSLMWKPPAPGKYTIIARFEGTDAYWSSSAETAIGVKETILITTELAIILAVVAVAVIIIVGYWILRNLR